MLAKSNIQHEISVLSYSKKCGRLSRRTRRWWLVGESLDELFGMPQRRRMRRGRGWAGICVVVFVLPGDARANDVKADLPPLNSPAEEFFRMKDCVLFIQSSYFCCGCSSSGGVSFCTPALAFPSDPSDSKPG